MATHEAGFQGGTPAISPGEQGAKPRPSIIGDSISPTQGAVILTAITAVAVAGTLMNRPRSWQDQAAGTAQSVAARIINIDKLKPLDGNGKRIFAARDEAGKIVLSRTTPAGFLELTAAGKTNSSGNLRDASTVNDVEVRLTPKGAKTPAYSLSISSAVGEGWQASQDGVGSLTGNTNIDSTLDYGAATQRVNYIIDAATNNLPINPAGTNDLLPSSQPELRQPGA